MSKKLITFLLAILFAQLCIAEVITVSQGTQGKPTVDKGKQDKPSVDKGKQDASSEFKARFLKKYPKASDAEYRLKVFMANKASYDAHNKDTSNTEKMGVTKFSDLTQAEFVAKMLTLKANPKRNNNLKNLNVKYTPYDVNWVVNGKVTPVRDQGYCGSCWAFSALGALESALILRQQTNIQEGDLSEQELVDCSGEYGNYGCNGGLMTTSYQYIMQHGISTEDDYPYIGEDQDCGDRHDAFRVANFSERVGCSPLADALLAGPVAVAVDATRWSGYISGVLAKCGTSLNHGVVLVGSNKKEWVLKNSWGADWGENGFIRIRSGNTCGICAEAVVPTF